MRYCSLPFAECKKWARPIGKQFCSSVDSESRSIAVDRGIVAMIRGCYTCRKYIGSVLLIVCVFCVSVLIYTLYMLLACDKQLSFGVTKCGDPWRHYPSRSRVFYSVGSEYRVLISVESNNNCFDAYVLKWFQIKRVQYTLANITRMTCIIAKWIQANI